MKLLLQKEKNTNFSTEDFSFIYEILKGIIIVTLNFQGLFINIIF